MLGFAPIASAPIASLPSSSEPASINAAAAWTEGSDTFAASLTVSAPAGISAAIGWVEGVESFVLVGGTPPSAAPTFSGYTIMSDAPVHSETSMQDAAINHTVSFL